MYLIDEPSAYLDSEQRIVASKVIKVLWRRLRFFRLVAAAPSPRDQRFIMHSRKTAFVVEHDFIMATYLADKGACCVGVVCAL